MQCLPCEPAPPPQPPHWARRRWKPCRCEICADESAPGLLRGVVLPGLRHTLLLGLIGAALASPAPMPWRPWSVSDGASEDGASLLATSVAAAIATVLAVALARALLIKPATTCTLGVGDPEALRRCLANADAYALRLGKALRLKTVSYDPEPADPSAEPAADAGGSGGARDEHIRLSNAEILKLHALLQKSYPRVHKHLKRTVIGNYSLLYEWEGSEACTTQPYMVYAHLDVVRAPESLSRHVARTPESLSRPALCRTPLPSPAPLSNALPHVAALESAGSPTPREKPPRGRSLREGGCPIPGSDSNVVRLGHGSPLSSP